MRVAFRDHTGKGRLVAAALTEAGHDIVTDRGDVALLDADLPVPPFKDICDRHERVLLYPHGGGNPFAGPEWPTHPNTVCRFVPGPGQADVLSRCGYPAPVEVIGWPFSDRRPFKSRPPVNVLFAPFHQLGNGWLPAACFESNGRVHDLLAELPVNLTVRYPLVGTGDLAEIGITRRSGVTYRQVPFDVGDGIAAIEAADVVVAGEGTFPSLAVALGCPTVMTCQVPPDDGVIEPRSWQSYEADARYPLDGDDADTPGDLMDLLQEACRGDTAVAPWRDRFVGEQFDPTRFVKTFEAVASCG